MIFPQKNLNLEVMLSNSAALYTTPIDEESFCERFFERLPPRSRRYRLRTTNYELRTTNYELRTTNYELRTTNYEPRTLPDLIL